MSEDLLRLIRDMNRKIAEANESNIALQGVCSLLFCEIALLHKDPRAKLDQMLTGLQGMVHGVSREVQNRTMTAVIERISQMSEAALIDKRR